MFPWITIVFFKKYGSDLPFHRPRPDRDRPARHPLVLAGLHRGAVRRLVAVDETIENDAPDARTAGRPAHLGVAWGDPRRADRVRAVLSPALLRYPSAGDSHRLARRHVIPRRHVGEHCRGVALHEKTP